MKKNNGRRKVEMVKMKNESNLQVTFSKRRAGLFKKANELCTLCGIDIALIVFSPGGKVFSFGHPNLDLLLDRYSGLVEDSPPRNTNNSGLSENNTNLCLQNLNEMLTKVIYQLSCFLQYICCFPLFSKLRVTRQKKSISLRAKIKYVFYNFVLTFNSFFGFVHKIIFLFYMQTIKLRKGF